MKTKARLVLFMYLFAIPYLGVTQCGTIHTISYDTTVTGGGSADPGYTFSMPKFDAGLGTLLNVKIISVVTINFSYTIENRDASAGNKTTKVRVTRNDVITGPSLDTSFDFFSPQTTYILPPSDGIPGSGPDFRSIPPYYVLNQDTIANLTVNNTADYMGLGAVDFNYRTDLGSVVTGNVNVNLLGSANDLIKFSVVYTYCDNIMLASDITGFSANKKDQFIELRWFTNNELHDRKYELQKSTDGKNFTTVAKLASAPSGNQTGSYSYNYPPSNEKGKIIFRVKQIERNGTAKYSPVRIVDLGNNETKQSIRLIPNPTSGEVTVILNNTIRSDWDVQLFNMKGQVISRKQVYNGLLVKINTDNKLSPGVYFVMAINKKTKEKFVERLVVN